MLRYPQANCEGTIPPNITEQRAGFLHNTQSLAAMCVCVYIYKHIYTHTYIHIYLEWFITVIKKVYVLTY